MTPSYNIKQKHLNMDLFEIYWKLDKNTRSIIRVFVLGLGTPEANLLKDFFAKINEKKKTISNPEYQDNLTPWCYKIVYQNPRKDIMGDIGTWRWFALYAELKLALLEGQIFGEDPTYLDPILNQPGTVFHPITYYKTQEKILFKRHYETLIYLKPQTPSARIIWVHFRQLYYRKMINDCKLD